MVKRKIIRNIQNLIKLENINIQILMNLKFKMEEGYLPTNKEYNPISANAKYLQVLSLLTNSPGMNFKRSRQFTESIETWADISRECNRLVGQSNPRF
jgi:hypothetical protein